MNLPRCPTCNQDAQLCQGCNTTYSGHLLICRPRLGKRGSSLYLVFETPTGEQFRAYLPLVTTPDERQESWFERFLIVPTNLQDLAQLRDLLRDGPYPVDPETGGLILPKLLPPAAWSVRRVTVGQHRKLDEVLKFWYPEPNQLLFEFMTTEETTDH